jgi:nucleotide-binding universal stress UspA family protein
VPDPRRVVVGVDGSATSGVALQWAAHEAALRGAVLEVVHAEFFRHEVLDLFAPDMEEGERSLLDRAVAQARQAEPGLEVVGRELDPPAADALVAAGRDAEMIVVGSRGLSRVKGMALGSVSRACIARARCPVVVIGPDVVHGLAPTPAGERPGQAE